MEIRAIQPEDTYDIRQKVMWPDKSIDFVKVEEDKEGYHFGLFEGNELISIVSLFYKNNEAQFRKFATRIEYHGKGYGTELLKFVFQEAENKGAERIWCNARSNKTAFYAKFGMRETPIFFTKEGVAYVVMEKVNN